MIILKYKYGRLGNQLFRFVHFIAFGKENKVHVSFPGFYDYAKYFIGTKNNLLCSYPEICISLSIPNPIRKIIYDSVPLLKRLSIRLDLQKQWYHHLTLFKN